MSFLVAFYLVKGKIDYPFIPVDVTTLKETLSTGIVDVNFLAC